MSEWFVSRRISLICLFASYTVEDFSVRRVGVRWQKQYEKLAIACGG